MWLDYLSTLISDEEEPAIPSQQADIGARQAKSVKQANDGVAPEIADAIAEELTEEVANAADNAHVIISAREILHILQIISQRQNEVSMLFRGEENRQLSKIVHIDVTSQEFYLRQSWQDQLELKVPRHLVNLSAPYHSHQVVISAQINRLQEWQATPCYVARLPNWMLSTEMRNFARIGLIAQQAATAQIFWQQGAQCSAKIIDLSESGFRLRLAPAQAAHLNSKLSAILSNLLSPNNCTACLRFTLHLSQSTAITVGARLRYCMLQRDFSDLGWEIMKIEEKDANILRRFILKAHSIDLTLS